MVVANRINMSDLSRQKRLAVTIGDDGISESHTVEQAIGHFRNRLGIRDNGFRFVAFSRGIKLKNDQKLADVPEADSDWMVLPEVTAGSRV